MWRGPFVVLGAGMRSRRPCRLHSTPESPDREAHARPRPRLTWRRRLRASRTVSVSRLLTDWSRSRNNHAAANARSARGRSSGVRRNAPKTTSAISNPMNDKAVTQTQPLNRVERREASRRRRRHRVRRTRARRSAGCRNRGAGRSRVRGRNGAKKRRGKKGLRKSTGSTGIRRTEGGLFANAADWRASERASGSV